MPLPSLRRRAAVLVGAGALTLTAFVVTAPPASAAVLNGLASTDIDFGTGGGGGCTVTNAGSGSGVLPWVSGGASFAANAQQTSVATDPGDAGDVTNMSAGLQATAQATEAAGALTGFSVEAHLTAAVNAVQGAATDCSSQASSSLSSQGLFTLTTPAILDLRISTQGTGLAQSQVLLQRMTAPTGQLFDINIGLEDRTRRIVTLPAGDYVFVVTGAAVAVEPDAPTDPTNTDYQVKAKGSFSAPGAAPAAQKGTGSKYLTLPGGLTCSTHSVIADFTKKAGPKATKDRKSVISKATFFVNDAKVAKVKKPHKKTDVTLGGLPDTDELVVEARLRLRGKGTVTVTRTYLPCT
jgi:hypothetical protein